MAYSQPNMGSRLEVDSTEVEELLKLFSFPHIFKKRNHHHCLSPTVENSATY